MISWIRPKIDRLLLADRNYAFLFQPDKSGEIVSLDCETTGFNPMADDVISIAAVKISGTRILASQAFRALIRPGAPMGASAIKVHQLREQDVARGRTMREVLPDFLRFVGSRPLVGYWIAFDVRMLNKYLFSLLNVHLPNRRIDVSKLYYDAFEDALGAAESYLVLEDMRERGVRLPRQWPAAYGGMRWRSGRWRRRSCCNGRNANSRWMSSAAGFDAGATTRPATCPQRMPVLSG
jgi:DNA polymerase III subunit epsilon